MTKQDYDKAARIVRERRNAEEWLIEEGDASTARSVENAFVELFLGDPWFDEKQFRTACAPDTAAE